MTSTQLPAATVTDPGASAHMALAPTTPPSAPSHALALGTIHQAAGVPTGDETEQAHQGHVVQELCEVAAAAVVQHAADTFERE